jgi:hypothetical protein
MSDVVRLTHPDSPGEIKIHLPMNMGLVGNVFVALGELGFDLPDADKATKMELTATVQMDDDWRQRCVEWANAPDPMVVPSRQS